MATYDGIDVSAFQGGIDWPLVKESNIDFVMLRAFSGWGHSEKQNDKHFHKNAYEAAYAGIHLGAYQCTLATTVDEMHRETECFLQTIDGYSLAYPIALDIEDRTLKYLNTNKLNKIVQTWCDDLRASGYYPMIRAHLASVYNRLNTETLANNDLWLIQYKNTPDYRGKFGMWQYTSSGIVKGIKGRVNCDRSYNDYPSIIGEKGLNGFNSHCKGKLQPEEFPSTEEVSHMIETLSNILSLKDVLETLLDSSNIQSSAQNTVDNNTE